MGCHAILQGNFPAQGSCLLHCRWILYPWATQEAHSSEEPTIQLHQFLFMEMCLFVSCFQVWTLWCRGEVCLRLRFRRVCDLHGPSVVQVGCGLVLLSVSFSSCAVHLDWVDVWAPLLVPCARGHISECCIQAKNREGWAETSPAGSSFSSWWRPSSLPPFLYRGRGVSGMVRGEFSERPGLCKQLLLQQQQQKKQSLNSE